MPKDCVGKASFDFIHPDDKDMTIEWFNKCVAQKKTQAKIENRQVNVKTGESFTVLWSSAFDYDESGELSGVGGIGRDITLRKKAEKEKSAFEAQLRHTQKMEAVGTLSGGIAHDFNNILTVILGYAEMVKNQIQDWSPAKKDIDEVLKAGNRAKELVKQILAFSRKAEPSPVPLEIHLLIKETINFLRATLPTTIKIQTNIDPDIGYILADPSQIHQVLMNLCTNAFHAMEETGGILSIDSTVVDLKPDQLEKEPGLKPGPYVLISVKDTGAGIKNELIDRIFDPYFTTKEFGKGTGMGLAVVHGIMKSHNGLITVDSMPDQGTTFKLFFPETEAGADEQPPDKISMPAGKEKILIADDDISIANLTKKRLEILGYQATAKTSSLDILELFRTNPNAFDLLITDQTMPDMTGVQLAKEFIGIRPDIRIIMCTGYSSTIDADRANHIGISAFIMKPVDHLTLAKTVRMVLDAT